MNSKKIFFGILITAGVVGLVWWGYKKYKTLSGNPDKDNRQINIFRTDK